jgi:hypothetical protein
MARPCSCRTWGAHCVWAAIHRHPTSAPLHCEDRFTPLMLSKVLTLLVLCTIAASHCHAVVAVVAVVVDVVIDAVLVSTIITEEQGL